MQKSAERQLRVIGILMIIGAPILWWFFGFVRFVGTTAWADVIHVIATAMPVLLLVAGVVGIVSAKNPKRCMVLGAIILALNVLYLLTLVLLGANTTPGWLVLVFNSPIPLCYMATAYMLRRMG